jgi:hypothetical protein
VRGNKFAVLGITVKKLEGGWKAHRGCQRVRSEAEESRSDSDPLDQAHRAHPVARA